MLVPVTPAPWEAEAGGGQGQVTLGDIVCVRQSWGHTAQKQTNHEATAENNKQDYPCDLSGQDGPCNGSETQMRRWGQLVNTKRVPALTRSQNKSKTRYHLLPLGWQ